MCLGGLRSPGSHCSVASRHQNLYYFLRLNFYYLPPQETLFSLQDAFPGGREIIRQAFKIRQAPEPSLDALLALLAPSTIKQYTRPLRSWWYFCQARQITPFAPEVKNVLDYLAEELKAAGSYSTLNTSRLAVSLVSINAIEEDPLVKGFCKGASVLKLPRPRYDHMWDPAPVIAKLASYYSHEELSLERLSKKLALLLALRSGQRCQTIAALRVSQISLGERKIIRVPDRNQPLLSFPRFTERSNLCIMNLLKHYLHRTQNLRPKECDNLFISLKHRSVGVQTISRWIRETLTECGVDSSFLAHSTRHASTSLAAKKGVSMDIIKRAADWSDDSQVFAKFYNKPIINSDEFAKATLAP